MKKYFYSAIAASMLFACSQEDIVDVTGGESQMKTFKVEIPQVESRTVGGITLGAGTQADALIYAMYENGGDETTPLISGVVYDGQGNENDGIFTVTVPMAKDLKYDLLFLAYNETNTAFEIASDAKTTNLKELKFKADQTANIDAFDAFTGALKAQGINDANEVTLKRPFAQINAATSKTDMDNAKTLKLNVTQSKLVIKGVPQYYNVLEAAASGSVDVTYAASAIMECDGPNASNQAYPNEMIEVDGTNYYYLTLAYVLAGEVTTTSTHNATFEFQRANGQSVSTLEIVSLPIQRNYRTNVIGDLLTKSEEYEIKIDAGFGGAHKLYFWNGKDVSEPKSNDTEYLISTAAEWAWLKGKQLNGKNIKLTNNIDFGGHEVKGLGFTGEFDGQGYTMSNLTLLCGGSYYSNGLFQGDASGEVTVKNVTIQNVVAECASPDYGYVGTIFGDVQNNVTLDNVHVVGADLCGVQSVGGLVGFVAQNKTLTINNCSVSDSHIYNYKVDGESGFVCGMVGKIQGTTTITGNENKVTNVIIDGIYASNRGEATIDWVGALRSTTSILNGKNLVAVTGGSLNKIPMENVKTVSSNDELSTVIKNLASGSAVINLTEGEYTIPSDVAGKTLTISGTEDTKISVKSGLSYATGATVTFDGVTIQSEPEGAGYTNGFADFKYATFKNCVIEGTIGLDFSCEFNKCIFNISGNFYNVWTWGAGTATFNECTFNCDGKALLVYANVLDNGTSHQTVNITNCIFNDNGDDSITGKAAIEITDTYPQNNITYTVNIVNTTVNGFSVTTQDATTFGGTDLGTNVWGNKNLLTADDLDVIINGTEVY